MHLCIFLDLSLFAFLCSFGVALIQSCAEKLSHRGIGFWIWCWVWGGWVGGKERENKGKDQVRGQDMGSLLVQGWTRLRWQGQLWMGWLGEGGAPRWLQEVCQGYPLSEEVCGAVEGERRLRAVEVQDRSERSERSEASEAGRKRWTKPSRKSCCCWVMAWEMRQGSACRLPVTESSLSSNVPMRLSSSSLRSCSSDTRSYITFWV